MSWLFQHTCLALWVLGLFLFTQHASQSLYAHANMLCHVGAELGSACTLAAHHQAPHSHAVMSAC